MLHVFMGFMNIFLYEEEDENNYTNTQLKWMGMQNSRRSSSKKRENGKTRGKYIGAQV